MSQNITENYDIKDSKIDITKPDKNKRGVDALNQHRPYCASDFVPKPWIQDLTNGR